jgi:hypothetical protein
MRTTATVAPDPRTFKIHPLTELFPPLPPDELEKLKSDIELHGQIDPITVTDDGLTLLDGVHRLKVCTALEIPPRWIRFCEVADKRMSVAEFIWSKNRLRRHLTPDQLSMVAVKWSDTEKACAKERQKEGVRPSGESAHFSGRVRKKIAEKIGVSQHKVRQAERIAKHAPQLVERVSQGEMKLKEAEKTIPVAVTVEKKPQTQMDVTVSYAKGEAPVKKQILTQDPAWIALQEIVATRTTGDFEITASEVIAKDILKTERATLAGFLALFVNFVRHRSNWEI